jgi:Xaa-Pro aminopeptidase
MADSRPDWEGRLQRVDRYCAGHELEALVVSAPINLKYLTGFSGSSGLLVVGPAGRVFITDGRYAASVRDAMRGERLASMAVEQVGSRYDLTLGESIRKLGVREVGFEAAHVTVATLRRWQEAAAGVRFQPTEDVVEQLRLIKDAAETAILRDAGLRLSGVATALSSLIARDRTELETARAIDLAIERAGFERPAFETIVASGPNSAYPHARPTDRRLRPGDPVVLDFGGVLGGYCVDLTRMAAIGQLEPSAERLFFAVRDAQAAALRAVRPGVLGSDVDGAARDVLESRGLGDAFLHGTGHGLGLEVHEGPRLAKAASGCRDVLEAGMVCTIEPGAYVNGVGGVRLEDDVLVTTEGSEALTTAPVDLVVV